MKRKEKLKSKRNKSTEKIQKEKKKEERSRSATDEYAEWKAKDSQALQAEHIAFLG